MAIKAVTKRKIKRVDERDLRKLVMVQERQIEAQAVAITALESVLLGVAELYVYDHVNPMTGEVKKGWQR